MEANQKRSAVFFIIGMVSLVLGILLGIMAVANEDKKPYIAIFLSFAGLTLLLTSYLSSRTNSGNSLAKR